MYVKKILLYLLITLSFSVNAGLGDYLENGGEFSRRIRQEFADLDIQFKIKFLDLDLFEGVNLSSYYRYKIGPSYIANHFTRLDRWVVKLDLKSGDLLSDKVPLSFGIVKGSEVFFVRQFESKMDAFKAKVYTPKRLPLNAEVAMNKLKPGDFVSIPANMDLSFSVKVGYSEIASGINAGARVFYVLSGKFLIHVFRMKDNYVRLKIFATKSQSGGGSIEADIKYKPFGMSFLNKALKRAFDLELFDLSYEKGSGDQLVLDYIFDFKSEDAKKAYNQILSSTYKFRDLDILKEFVQERELENRLISNFELAEDISYEDRDLPNPRVRRVFKGFNKYSRLRKRFHFSMILARYDNNKIYIENKITFEDKNGERKRFFYPIYTERKEYEIGFWPFEYEENSLYSYFGLMRVDSNGEGRDFSDLGISYSLDDSFFMNDEQRVFRRYVRSSLPEKLYNKIVWSDWDQALIRRGARGFFEVIFKGNAFDHVEFIREHDLRRKLVKYYENLADHNIDFGGFFERLGARWSIFNGSLYKNLRRISKKIHKILFSDLTGNEKVSLLMGLRSDKIFNRVGVGFLISLLDEDKIKDLIYTKLSLHAIETSEVKYSFGELEFSEVYRELQDIQNAINNRSYDLRYNSDDVIFDRTKILDPIN